MDFFRSIFFCMSHLSTYGPSSTVFKHLQDYFHLKDSTNGFIQLHQLCSHVAINYISRFVVPILGANRLLALAKFFGGIHLIAVGKTLYWLMNKALCL